MELKEKSDRGESVNSITFKELCDKFLKRESGRVSDIPHRGITKVRYRLIKSQIKWIRDFVNNDKIMIHKMRKNTFASTNSEDQSDLESMGKIHHNLQPSIQNYQH